MKRTLSQRLAAYIDLKHADGLRMTERVLENMVGKVPARAHIGEGDLDLPRHAQTCWIWTGPTSPSKPRLVQHRDRLRNRIYTAVHHPRPVLNYDKVRYQAPRLVHDFLNPDNLLHKNHHLIQTICITGLCVNPSHFLVRLTADRRYEEPVPAYGSKTTTDDLEEICEVLTELRNSGFTPTSFEELYSAVRETGPLTHDQLREALNQSNPWPTSLLGRPQKRQSALVLLS